MARLSTYVRVSHLDTAVHAVTPGSAAAVACYLLLRADAVPDHRAGGAAPSWFPVLFVTAIGTAGAVLWEVSEWVRRELDSVSMRIGYDDTVEDLLAGLLGSLVAGTLVWWYGRTQR